MPTIPERRAAYRKAKEEAQKRHEHAVESVRWRITMQVLTDFPDAEFSWEEVEDHPGHLLKLRIKLNDYVGGIMIGRGVVDEPEWVPILSAQIRDELSKGPIRHLFE